MATFLTAAVQARLNIVISGGTGSGKTTLLNMMSSFIPAEDRILTVEDSAELRLPQEHVVSLESRPPNIEGEGAITIRDLVRNALRMRPDRIVVGECRGGEALDMLQAMNTGHDGSLTTVHANTPRDALARLETMALMSGLELPSKAIRDQIGSAINLIIQQSRLQDGTRRITHITEVTGQDADGFTTEDIFLFKQTGVAPDGRISGQFVPTGHVPAFIETFAHRGVKVPRELFLHQTA
jgi:pilus assembly protein CpaF